VRNLTSGQLARQFARTGATGQYRKNPCDGGCGHGAPLEDYASHPDTDVTINDELLVLCHRCYCYLAQFDGPTAILKAAEVKASGKRAPLVKGTT